MDELLQKARRAARRAGQPPAWLQLQASDTQGPPYTRRWIQVSAIASVIDRHRGAKIFLIGQEEPLWTPYPARQIVEAVGEVVDLDGSDGPRLDEEHLERY